MKNIKNQIELKLKENNELLNKTLSELDFPLALADKLSGKSEAFKEVLDIISDNNKSMKIEEFVKKLNDSERTANWNIIIRADSTVIENSNFPPQYIYIFNNKRIGDISEYVLTDEYKWVYELWINNVEIED